ncbi:MAG: proline racemase family protein [Actinomycetota bacterium]
MQLPPGPIETAEYHTAGEPFRIVTAGVPTPEGATVLDRRSWSEQHLDDVRAFLVNEPRGHAGMYGGIVTPPNDDGGDIGVVFFHKDGFSTACGHGTIALATWALDTGRVAGRPIDGTDRVELFVDVPSGRLRVEATRDTDGRVAGVRFWNVDAYVTARALPIDTSRGPIPVDISFGGAFYASVALDGTDLAPAVEDLGHLVDLARELRTGLVDHPAAAHAVDDRLSGVYGVIFHQDLGPDTPDDPDGIAVRQRNVTVFADGEIDRSPCGSGTSARLAALVAAGRLRTDQRLANDGVAGGTFDGRVEACTDHEGRTLVATSVAGAAYATGRATFQLDPRDPIGLGFQLV